MVDCYACKSGFGPMFIEIVTLLRFEIPGAIGELESKDFLTEGNGRSTKKSPRGRSPRSWIKSSNDVFLLSVPFRSFP